MEWIVTLEAAVDPAAVQERLAALHQALQDDVVGASVDLDAGALGATLIVESAEVEDALHRGLGAWRRAEEAAGLEPLTLSSAEVVAAAAGAGRPTTSPEALRAG